MKISNISFTAIKKVSTGKCSLEDIDKKTINVGVISDINKFEKAPDSIKEAGAKLFEESKKLNEPHTLFAVSDKTELEAEYAEKKRGVYTRPLVKVDYFIATGEEYELIKKADDLQDSLKKIEHNIKKDDVRSLTYIFARGSVFETLKPVKNSILRFLAEFGKNED